MRGRDAYTLQAEHRKAEFLLIAVDTEKSHMLKNTSATQETKALQEKVLSGVSS